MEGFQLVEECLDEKIMTLSRIDRVESYGEFERYHIKARLIYDSAFACLFSSIDTFSSLLHCLVSIISYCFNK